MRLTDDVPAPVLPDDDAEGGKDAAKFQVRCSPMLDSVLCPQLWWSGVHLKSISASDLQKTSIVILPCILCSNARLCRHPSCMQHPPLHRCTVIWPIQHRIAGCMTAAMHLDDVLSALSTLYSPRPMWHHDDNVSHVCRRMLRRSCLLQKLHSTLQPNDNGHPASLPASSMKTLQRFVRSFIPQREMSQSKHSLGIPAQSRQIEAW